MTGPGPNHDWGVDQMQVGFNQVIDTAYYYATYDNDETMYLSTNSLSPVNDTPKQLAAGGPIWLDRHSAGFISNWPNVRQIPGVLNNANTLPHMISSFDVLKVPIPAYYNEASVENDGESPIRHISLSATFTDYIIAGVRNSVAALQSPVANTYTILAMAPPALGKDYSWGWSTNGLFDFLIYSQAIGSLQGPAGAAWQIVTNGSTADPGLPQGNLRADKAEWEKATS